MGEVYLRGYQVAGDGSFIAHQRLPDTGIHREVVLKWFEELNRIAPAR